MNLYTNHQSNSRFAPDSCAVQGIAWLIHEKKIGHHKRIRWLFIFLRIILQKVQIIEGNHSQCVTPCTLFGTAEVADSCMICIIRRDIWVSGCGCIILTHSSSHDFTNKPIFDVWLSCSISNTYRRISANFEVSSYYFDYARLWIFLHSNIQGFEESKFSSRRKQRGLWMQNSFLFISFFFACRSILLALAGI